MSRVTAIISVLVICIIVCLRQPLTTVITPLLHAQCDKNARELEAGERGTTDMQMRHAMLLRLSVKYTKELADAKAENDALRDDAAAIVVGCTSGQSVSRVKPPRPPAWIMQPPPTGRHR